MRRTAVFLTVFGQFALIAAGCKSSGKQEEMALDAEPTAQDAYLPPAQEQPYSEPAAYPAYGAPVPVDNAYDAASTMESTGPRYHTVVRHDTLYGLARSYYGDQRRWKDIYEANRATIGDPNKIRVGQRLVIP